MTVDEQTPPVTIDPDKLMAFVFRAVDEVGATLNAALVVMGDRLGYYRALAEHGPIGAAELAQRTSTGDAYAREWLNAQAAGQYVSYDPASGTYALCPEYAIALTGSSGPAISPTSSTPGCRGWTAWSTSCGAGDGWPTSAAASARRRC